MHTLIGRLRRRLRYQVRGWRLPLAIAVVVFATSWPLMVLAEPAGNAISAPANYWWWFLVTAATVGYGDFFPTTTWGHLVGAYVIVGGIVALTVLFTRLADYVQTVRGVRMQGKAQHDLRDHVVLLGYTPGRTEKIVAELGAENEVEIVLGAWDDVVAEHPMASHDRVAFVRGDLTDVDTLGRACATRASTVVIDVRDDNETLAIAVAVHHVAPDVPVVATLRELSRSEHLHYVDAAIQCVQWHSPKLLVEEVSEPGITEVYADLMTSGGRSNTYVARLLDSAPGTFGECQQLFGERHGATLIAVRHVDGLQISPPWNTPVAPGARLYYLASERVSDDSLVATPPA